jgi:sigma-B regulation protein RsbU (phosphoserine phosphatase)
LRYRRLWETTPDAILMMDEQGVIAFVNPAAEVVFGLRAADLAGRNFASLLAAGEADMAPILETWANPPKDTPLFELAGRHATGRAVVMEVAFSDMEMAGRRWQIAFIRDITARREAEIGLQKAEQEFGLAREIQQNLFPKSAPRVPGFDIAGASFPAVQTGGDAFDFLPMPEGDLGVVVSDVSGHGMGPSLIMAATRAYLRIVAYNRRDAGLVFNRASQVLAEDLEGSGRFVTALLIRLSPVERRLGFVNAGHTAGYVMDAAGCVRHTLARSGPPLGLDADTSYTESASILLETGDTILMLTDGIVETEAPRASDADPVDTFGDQRFLEVVRAHRAAAAAEIIAAVRAAATEFRGSGVQEDDLTMVVIKVL